MTIFNTIIKNIFTITNPRNLFSRAGKDRHNVFRMLPMQIFIYPFESRTTMTVSPNNMKGTIMKFKRNILRASTILALSLFALQTFAESAPLSSSINTAWNPYVGVSAGYARMAAKNNWSEKGLISTLSGKNNFNSKGIIGTFYVGVQKHVSSRMKVGIELYGFLESNKASVVTGTRVESLKKENGGGIKVKAGYLFDTHTSVYAHVGVEKAGLKYAVSRVGTVAMSKKYLWGAPFGLGVETALGSSWSARVEYTHVIYQKWTTPAKSISNTATSKNKISPSQDTLVLGVSYAF